MYWGSPRVLWRRFLKSRGWRHWTLIGWRLGLSGCQTLIGWWRIKNVEDWNRFDNVFQNDRKACFKEKSQKLGEKINVKWKQESVKAQEIHFAHALGYWWMPCCTDSPRFYPTGARMRIDWRWLMFLNVKTCQLPFMASLLSEPENCN